MPAYTCNATLTTYACCNASLPLLLMVLEITNSKTNSDAKMVAYADDFSAAGSILSLKYWWDTLCELGPKFGYFPEPWVIEKSNCYDKAIHILKYTYIQIKAQAKRHLDAALSTSQFRDKYVMEKTNKRIEELQVLSEIAKTEPPAAYTCFLSGYKNKLNYYMIKNPGIGKLLRMLDEVSLAEIIPAITGGITITENERKLLSLAPRLGELGIPIFEE